MLINPWASPVNAPQPSKTCQNIRAKTPGSKLFSFADTKNSTMVKPASFMVYKSTRQLTVPYQISLRTQQRSDMEAQKAEKIQLRTDSVEKYDTKKSEKKQTKYEKVLASKSKKKS